MTNLFRRFTLARALGVLSFVAAALAAVPENAAAQRGATGPAEHAFVEPVNHLPNPYETVRNFGVLPDGRSWGSVSAINVDIDGIHIWAGDRCGANSCAGSDVDPMVRLDPDGNVAKHYKKVKPKTHSQEVLADLAKLARTP